MFRPSTAPRWKTAIRSRLRAVAPSATRARNDGAKPSDTIAIAPDFTKMRREIMALSLLEFRPANLCGSLRACDLLRHVHAGHERAGGDPRVRGVVVPGGRLAHVRCHAQLL